MSFRLSSLIPSCSTIRLHIILLLTQITFSTINIYGSISLKSIEPIPLTALRFWCTVPISLMLALVFEREELTKSIRDWRGTFLRVGLGVGVVQSLTLTLYAYGLKFSNPINCGTLYLATVPLTAALGMSLGYEKKMILKVIGIMFSISGALVTMELDKFSISNKSIIGDICILFMVVFYSIYLVFSKSLSRNMGIWTVTFWMFLFGGLSCIIALPFLFLFESFPITPLAQFSTDLWVSIFIVCYVGTMIPYMFTNWALKNTSSLVVAAYSPLELVTTILLGMVILNLQLKLLQAIGASLIVCGLIIVLFSKYREKAREKILRTTGDSEIEVEKIS